MYNIYTIWDGTYMNIRKVMVNCMENEVVVWLLTWSSWNTSSDDGIKCVYIYWVACCENLGRFHVKGRFYKISKRNIGMCHKWAQEIFKLNIFISQNWVGNIMSLTIYMDEP